MSLYSDLNHYTPTSAPLLYDVAAVYQSLDIILNALRYQRLFRPDFPGETLSDVLFELIDATTTLAVQRVVRQSIARWEPRVKLQKVNITPDPTNNRYGVQLIFQIVGFGDQRFEQKGSLSR